jgi:hypothetical protein
MTSHFVSVIDSADHPKAKGFGVLTFSHGHKGLFNPPQTFQSSLFHGL